MWCKTVVSWLSEKFFTVFSNVRAKPVHAIDRAGGTFCHTANVAYHFYTDRRDKGPLEIRVRKYDNRFTWADFVHVGFGALDHFFIFFFGSVLIRYNRRLAPLLIENVFCVVAQNHRRRSVSSTLTLVFGRFARRVANALRTFSKNRRGGGEGEGLISYSVTTTLPLTTMTIIVKLDTRLGSSHNINFN